jgi:16S rRNA processing protein RimM
VLRRSDVVVTSARRHHGKLIVALDGVTSAEDAKPLAGRTLLVARDDIVLGRDEYLDDDLVGLPLVDEAGRRLATVREVRHYPAQDCLVVEPGDAFVPMVREFIRSVDLARGCIVVALPPGLLDGTLADEA